MRPIDDLSRLNTEGSKILEGEILPPVVDQPSTPVVANRVMGAPTKFTPDTRAKFLLAIGKGGSKRTACKFAGISYDTWCRWARRGRSGETAFLAFYNQVQEAESSTLLDVSQKLKSMALDGDAKAVMFYLERKDPESWGRPGTLRRDAALLRDNQDEDDESGQGGDMALAEWNARWVDPEPSFQPFELQRAAIGCDTRYVAIVAGVGGAKTHTGATMFWRRITEENLGPDGFYMLIAPDTTNGQVMCEWFVKQAPAGWLPNPHGTGQPYDRIWHLKSGARVQFRSADKPEKIVARRVNGMWIDEFTLMKPGAWRVSLRGRLIATSSGAKSWAIFTGTPRGKNWSYDEVWRKTLDHDDSRDPAWTGYTWGSSANPRVLPEDIAQAKRDIPEAFYLREYEASWEAFHGQCWPDFNADRDVSDFDRINHPKGATVEAGVDWGFAKPGALEVARFNPDESVDFLHEVQVKKKGTGWWIEEFKKARDEYGIRRFWADPAEPDRIAECQRAGLPFFPAFNARGPGIRYMGMLFRQQRVRVHASVVTLPRQIESYVWKKDKDGDDTEDAVKKSDHGPDGARYVTYSRHKVGSGASKFRSGGAG